jgi:hypothetical protein
MHRRGQRDETAFEAAFWRALVRWAACHADDATAPVIPSGATATTRELTRVVTAIASLRNREPAARSRP